MYNLHLSPEQLEIRDTVRDFVAREIKPLALAPDRLEARERPLLMDALDKASQMGLRTLALTEDRGGAGADNLTCCIVTEELAVGDPDIAAVLAQTSALAHAWFDGSMTPEQRDRFLPPFLADDRYHLALAAHEPDADGALGINYHRPGPLAAGGKTTARALGQRLGDQRVQGLRRERTARQAVRGAGEHRDAMAEHAAGAARRSRAEREGQRAGVRWCHGACGEVTFSDCQVPAENLLGAKARLPVGERAARAASRRIRRSISASAAPPTRRRSTTRSCGCRAGAASSSTRRSA